MYPTTKRTTMMTTHRKTRNVARKSKTTPTPAIGLMRFWLAACRGLFSMTRIIALRPRMRRRNAINDAEGVKSLRSSILLDLAANSFAKSIHRRTDGGMSCSLPRPTSKKARARVAPDTRFRCRCKSFAARYTALQATASPFGLVTAARFGLAAVAYFGSQPYDSKLS